MICAVVLAAGRSTRMGTQKLLLPLEEKAVVVRIVDELLLSPLGKVFVVVGRDREKIQDALNGRTVTFVANSDPESDMLGSVRCGLRALPANCDAVLVALGDQPAVTRELVAELIHARRTSQRGIIVPSHGGKRGHPMLFAARFRDELLTLHDGVGLHGLLDSHSAEVLHVTVTHADALADMDTPEDYRHQQARIGGGRSG